MCSNRFFHSLFLQSVHYLVNVILYIESSDQSMGQAIIVNAILGNILARFHRQLLLAEGKHFPLANTCSYREEHFNIIVPVTKGEGFGFV